MRGVILYGPPASGKDTVTAALVQADHRFHLFRRLKAGPGKNDTYRMVDRGHIDQLRRRGEIVWENERYGALYVVDTAGLLVSLRKGIPVLHLGQPEAITAVEAATPDASWLVVELRCSRRVAARRLAARNQEGVGARLQAWDETPLLPSSCQRFNTDSIRPSAAAQEILRQVNHLRTNDR